MRTRSSWGTCSGNTTQWTFSLPSLTNCPTTSPHYRSARAQILHKPTGCCRCFKLSLFFLLTARHHHPGCAAVLGRDFVCHNELALSQSVRTLQQFPINKYLFWHLSELSHLKSAQSWTVFLCRQSEQRQHVYLLVTCVSRCVADTRGSWKPSLRDQQVRRSFVGGDGPTSWWHQDVAFMAFTVCLCKVQHVTLLKHVFLKIMQSVLYHPGNQGLMDILDMPNTNKYSFEG